MLTKVDKSDTCLTMSRESLLNLGTKYSKIDCWIENFGTRFGSCCSFLLIFTFLASRKLAHFAAYNKSQPQTPQLAHHNDQMFNTRLYRAPAVMLVLLQALNAGETSSEISVFLKLSSEAGQPDLCLDGTGKFSQCDTDDSTHMYLWRAVPLDRENGEFIHMDTLSRRLRLCTPYTICQQD